MLAEPRELVRPLFWLTSLMCLAFSMSSVALMDRLNKREVKTHFQSLKKKKGSFEIPICRIVKTEKKSCVEMLKGKSRTAWMTVDGKHGGVRCCSACLLAAPLFG